MTIEQAYEVLKSAFTPETPFVVRHELATFNYPGPLNYMVGFEHQGECSCDKRDWTHISGQHLANVVSDAVAAERRLNKPKCAPQEANAKGGA